MSLLDSTAKGVRPLLQIFLLSLQLIQCQCVSAEEGPYKDCPAEMSGGNITRCVDPGTYHIKINGEICKITVNTTKVNCTQEESTGQPDSSVTVKGGDEGQSGLEPRQGYSCRIPKNYAKFTPLRLGQYCYEFRVSVCAPGNRKLNVYTQGRNWYDFYASCYAVHINGIQTKSYVFQDDSSCRRDKVTFYLNVNQELTTVTTTSPSYRTYSLRNKEFSLSICFGSCIGGGSIAVTDLSMFDFQSGAGDCDEEEKKRIEEEKRRIEEEKRRIEEEKRRIEEEKKREMEKKALSDCKQYNEKIPSQCWQRGCQFTKDAAKCITGKQSCEATKYGICRCSHQFCDNFKNTGECYPEADLFKNKLSCRRKGTYYAYHPKILCYNDKNSGNCEATATYAVNLGGEAMRDNGINYIADKNSNYRDPDNTHRADTRCTKDGGASVYDSAYVGDASEDTSKEGVCISYPIPICQTGEYMLTIRMTEPLYPKPNLRCTEARINEVPIMIDMDTFTLAGNKTCGFVDVALMFIATDGSDSNYALHLKGHVHPIQVINGKMELQFCIGYECLGNQYPAVSAFTLERLGKDPKKCN